jgi:hypothetical protein
MSLRDKVKTISTAELEKMAQDARTSIADMRGAFIKASLAQVADMQRHLAPGAIATGTDSEVYRLAHDLKGQGSTFNLDLVTKIAGSLCVHLRDDKVVGRDKRALAHCEALRVILDKDIRGTGGEYGARLLQILKIKA